MEIILNLVLLVVGFLLLLKGADFFVEGAAGIADKFHIPQIIIGLTIVAFGTSAPEAAVSISAGLKGTGGIAVGNVLGSNIFNILVILGITCCIRVLKVKEDSIKFDLPFLVMISSVMIAVCVMYRKLDIVSGLIFTVFFIIFLVQMVRATLKERKENVEKQEFKQRSMWLLLLFTLGGMAAIIYGSDLTVENAKKIAKVLGMSESLIGLTIISLGTSLPELITSITAARKGNADIAIGNIVGSNLFNILFVLGITSYITRVTIETNFIVDSIVGLIAVVLLYIFAIKDKKLGRAFGVLAIVGYVVYFSYLLIAR